jgi:hypothetical protein
MAGSAAACVIGLAALQDQYASSREALAVEACRLLAGALSEASRSAQLASGAYGHGVRALVAGARADLALLRGQGANELVGEDPAEAHRVWQEGDERGARAALAEAEAALEAALERRRALSQRPSSVALGPLVRCAWLRHMTHDTSYMIITHDT